MSLKFLFAGKTAIVTGSGGGLGRCYALELARRGANVVVNDLGGRLDGSTEGKIDTAGEVVKEIITKGGKAIANYDNVLDGSNIVNAAVKEFGRIDILVNNAGILRDKSFHKMTKEDWNMVMNVHLSGTFQLCHAAWPIMQHHNYGRIINIGSGAGLYGNFGQTNYSAAKMGILGLTNTLAIEGQKHNIHANCVVPIAMSRMTDTLLPAQMLDMLKPEHVAPLVAYLSHESCTSSGECYEVGGGWYAKVRIERSAGVSFGGQNGHVATVEDLAAKFSGICDFSQGATHPSTPIDALRDMLGAATADNTSAPPAATTATASTTLPKAAVSSSEVFGFSLGCDALFESLQQHVMADASRAQELANQAKVKVQFDICQSSNKSNVKMWLLDTASSEPSLTCVKTAPQDWKPYVVLQCHDETFAKLASGSLSPEFAFMRGLLKIKGSMGAAKKVKIFLDYASKLKI